MKKRIRLFSHTDLDGVVPNVLVKLAHKNDFVYITNTDYQFINEQILNFVSSGEIKDYNIIYITDISITAETAVILDQACIDYNISIHLFDHHKTAEHLNQYSWAFVSEGIEEFKYTGTWLFFEYLNKKYKLNDSARLLSEMTRQYDSWEWKYKYNDEMPRLLNDLFVIYGAADFVKKMICRVEHNHDLIQFYDRGVLKIEKNRIARYVKKKYKTLRKFDYNEYKVGLLYAEQHYSDLTLELSKEFPDVDILIIVNISEGGVSYRSINKNIDVSKIAQNFGGGGHAETAGSPLNKGFKQLLFEKKLL